MQAKKDDVEPLNGSETRDKSSRHVSFSPLENMETERPESNVMGKCCHIAQSFSWLTVGECLISDWACVTDRVGGPVLLTGQGLGIANSAMETVKIHEENQAKMQAMSQSEILEEQRRLMGQLGKLDIFHWHF